MEREVRGDDAGGLVVEEEGRRNLERVSEKERESRFLGF